MPRNKAPRKPPAVLTLKCACTCGSRMEVSSHFPGKDDMHFQVFGPGTAAYDVCLSSKQRLRLIKFLGAERG